MIMIALEALLLFLYSLGTSNFKNVSVTNTKPLDSKADTMIFLSSWKMTVTSRSLL